MTTNFDLSTEAGCEAMYASVKRNLRRDDFPATPAGWQQWCDHRIRKHTKEAAAANRSLEYYKQVREGEHMQVAAAKVADLQKALDEVKRLEAEVAKLKATPVKKS